MATGFYHSSRGYWETPNDPPQRYRDAYPAGTVEVPLRPGQDYEWSGSEWVYSPPPVTTDQVNAERDRRLAAGAVVTVTGYGDVAVQGRERDVSVYTNLALRAAQKLQAGDTSTFKFRDRDDVMHDLTPAQMAELMDKAGLAAQAIYAAAWALKDGAEIPQDYAEDKHWP
ncbi:DUF4376 domain-containing protein [Roseovarius sp.]